MPGAGFYGPNKPPPGASLNVGHEFAHGLRFAPIFNEGAGRRVLDYAGLKLLRFGNTVTWTSTKFGPALSFPGTGGQGASGSDLFLNGRPWTVSVRYMVSVDTDNYFWDLGQTGLDNEMHLLDGFAADWVNVNLYSDDHQIQTDKALGVFHHITITQAPDTTLSVYQNGVLKGTADAAGMFSGNAGAWYLGGRSIGGSDEFVGIIEHFMLWERAFTAREVKEHTEAPYQMFAPPVWRRYFLPLAPQFSQPDSDVSISGWSTHTGATTNLYQQIDETPRDDADYVLSADTPSSDTLILSLQPVTDPGVNNNFVVRLRLRKTTTSQINLTATLQAGTTDIATGTFNDISGELTEVNFLLTSGEVDSFRSNGGFADPRIKIVANAP
jgi:Concanavalin A-like lectin/glucanases superfamily